jgi:LAGLIDADG DNA endonuclease family protein
MTKNEMGNRGSKSETTNPTKVSVKEQRVDGSCCINSNLMLLRCTLMDYENSYLVNNLSKRLNNKQFSTLTLTPNYKLNPWFVSGLIDGEGTFYISIRKDNEYKLGWQIGAEFQIQLHKRDLNLLLQLQDFFSGIGSINISKTRQSVTYSVKSIKNIITIIIPHFLKYKLLTQKAADFILFNKIVRLINAKAHLTKEGLHQIINIKASLNLGMSENLKSYFTKITPIERPIIKTTNIPDPQWLAGFVSGEGCFDVNLKKSKTHKVGHQVILRISIKQHERDKNLMELITKYLNSGNIYRLDKRPMVSLTIVKYSDITNLIIPFFKKYPVLGIKQNDFSDWCKVAKLMNDGSHLTIEGLNLIRTIKEGMNKGRK